MGLKDLVEQDSVHETAHADAQERAGGDKWADTGCYRHGGSISGRHRQRLRLRPPKWISRTTPSRMGKGEMTASRFAAKWSSKRPERTCWPVADSHTGHAA